MKQLINISFVLLLGLSVSMTYGQDKLKVYGAGRFIIQNGLASGDLYEGGVFSGDTLAADTVNPEREMRGTALFDLGFQLNPNPNTEIRVLTRVTSDLDGFWGEGIGFGFRELYVRGLIKGKVRYRVGDLDLQMTPFTLYNYDADLGSHRLSSLHVFEDIVQYEQFYRDNRWRQQGVSTDFKLRLPGKGNSLGFEGFLAKNRQTDFFFLSDRLLSGGTMTYGKSGLGEFSYNIISMFDVAQTAQFSEASSANTVHTLAAKVQPLEDMPLVFYGEGGLSTNTYEEIANAPTDTNDVFFQLGVRKVDDPKLQYYAEFIHVGAGFRSPGAQSRRINPNALPLNFSYQGNQEFQRGITAFDLLLDPSVYNRTITPGLQPFLPAYNNITPYGTATPNRQGLNLGVELQNDSSVLNMLAVRANLLTEVSGEGIDQYRNFLGARVNARLALNELWEGEKGIMFELNGSFQNTTRDALETSVAELEGIGDVSLTSSFVEAGISVELAEDLYFNAGTLMLMAEGNEYMAMRDGFSLVEDFTEVTYDFNDQTLFGGFKYSFNQNTQLLMQYRRSNITQNLVEGTDYTIDQVTVLFNLFF